MIEVNLIPGDRKKRRARARRSLAIPSVPGLSGDRWVLGAGVLVAVALLAIGWMAFATAGQAEELEIQIESAVRDSARLADVIERSERLRSQGDSIARRVDVIQQIDGSRYIWPHIMDEVARALPDYTWLTRIQQVTSGEPMAFRIEGRAGTYFALTSFMEAVEASPFIRGTQLISSDQVFMSVGGGAQRLVYDFALEAEYRDPPPDLIQREPLFGGSVLAPGSEEN